MLRCPAQMNTHTGPQRGLWGRCWWQALLSPSHLPPRCIGAWQDCITAPSYLVLALFHNCLCYAILLLLNPSTHPRSISGFFYSTYPQYPSEHHRFVPETSQIWAFLHIPEDMVLPQSFRSPFSWSISPGLLFICIPRKVDHAPCYP